MSEPGRIWSAADAPRIEFLRQLDGADFEVTDWEAKFIANILGMERYRTELLLSLTDGQRRKIEQLEDAYAHRLPGRRARAAAPLLPPDEPGCCSYLIRPAAGGRQERCGRPARRVNRLGLELCPEHEAVRNQAIQQQAEFQKRRARSAAPYQNTP